MSGVKLLSYWQILTIHKQSAKERADFVLDVTKLIYISGNLLSGLHSFCNICCQEYLPTERDLCGLKTSKVSRRPTVPVIKMWL